MATLARIGLSAAEEEKYQKDLSTVLDWFARLAEVNTEHVQPIGHITGRSDVARRDVVLPAPPSVREGIVANFPEQRDGFLKVRSVF